MAACGGEADWKICGAALREQSIERSLKLATVRHRETEHHADTVKGSHRQWASSQLLWNRTDFVVV
jgi:hypothetical protein